MTYLNLNKKGFTLIELLVSIAIIGLLATLAVASFRHAREKTKIAKVEHELNQIYKAISMLVTDSGVWPNHQQYNTVCSDLDGGCPPNNELCGADINGATCATGGLDDGVAGILIDDVGNNYDNWQGSYMPRMPLDSWNHEYFFDTDYTVFSADLKPCHTNDVPPTCIDVVVLGSYGPDGIGGLNNDTMGPGNEDDIIKILK